MADVVPAIRSYKPFQYAQTHLGKMSEAVENALIEVPGVPTDILRALADKLDREAAAPENRGTSVGGKAASSPSLPVLFVPEVHRRSVWKRNN
jgi:hypothetical protein